MKLSGDWIESPGAQAVMHMLASGGHQAYFVGGCVRNALLHEPAGDIDIATDATPETVISLSKSAGLKPVETGLDHGTITVVAQDVPHEVTTFRKDIETDGRHATVSFSTDIAQDASRRDFTMNALYAGADGSVIDPLGGLDDLLARRVRFIGDATARIHEDYLRSLRFFRFAAWYGDKDAGLDVDALDAIGRNLDGLDQLSRERVGAEMTKLLAAPDPVQSIAAMSQTHVLPRILPGSDMTLIGPLVHLEGSQSVTPDPIRRLAALGGVDVPNRLRLSKAQAKRLTLLKAEMTGAMPAAEMGYRFGAETGRDILLLRWAMAGQSPDPGAGAALKSGAEATFPVRADDLPQLHGKALGDRLKKLEQAWIDADFLPTKSDLLAP